MVILKKPGPKQQDEQAAEASCPFAGEHVRLPLMAAEVGHGWGDEMKQKRGLHGVGLYWIAWRWIAWRWI